MDEQEPSWFSASLRRICLIEGSGAVDAWDEVFLQRASDWDKAFERALEIGKGREETYTNADGASVVSRFAEVVTLDEIRTNQLDGAEVFSSVAHVPTGNNTTSEHVFNPEESTPGSTGI
jgi:hypothetical protein